MPVKFKCPICGKSVDSKHPNSPFCSDRCRILDLGNWASEKYAIPSNVTTELDESEEARDSEGSDR